MPSNHFILCCPLLLPPSIFPSIRVFSNESALRIRWPKYWSFSFSISPSNEYSGLISFRMDWSKGLSRAFSNTTVQKHKFFGVQPRISMVGGIFLMAEGPGIIIVSFNRYCHNQVFQEFVLDFTITSNMGCNYCIFSKCFVILL